MGDFLKDNPDAAGAVISTIFVILITTCFKVESLVPLAPGISYIIALLISRSLIKKEGKEKSNEYSDKFTKMKNDRRSNLEKYTKMSAESKNPEHVEEIKRLIKKTTADIESLDKMEMEELLEIKQEMQRNKTTIIENNKKLAGAVRDNIKS
ncbi:hypothetical protein LF941_18285 [Pectobacterium versatile]|uniref:hypothetical protein n=1 Tax=Pectobacterium versatile TaxID=2488639 RepID=UPI001CF38A17|nr:hypothetical protein [Pectobacterium versatile]MCA6917338.1 hypothetical protein [Pectobacterium versatile]